jgi:acetyltransferase-like isoleucine patch superfamily enzyme
LDLDRREIEAGDPKTMKFLKQLILRPIKRIAIRVFNRVAEWREDDLPEFATYPKNLHISMPRTISRPKRIYIGDDVWLGPGALLSPTTRFPSHPLFPLSMPADFQQVFDPKITIGNRVTSTGGLILGAHQDVTIEDDVMFASNVMISDALHGYDTANVPYKYQPMCRIAPITVKRGCWIGQNVVILPGVTVGEQCIVGANSVVTKSIPPRSIAVGVPARVVKMWDEAVQAWADTTQHDEQLSGSLIKDHHA